MTGKSNTNDIAKISGNLLKSMSVFCHKSMK